MNDQPRIRVFSVDDHPLLREGIAAVVNSQPDMVMAAQAANGREAIAQFREVCPDVTLMDLRLPDISGIDALTAIRHEFPGAEGDKVRWDGRVVRAWQGLRLRPPPEEGRADAA